MGRWMTSLMLAAVLAGPAAAEPNEWDYLYSCPNLSVTHLAQYGKNGVVDRHEYFLEGTCNGTRGGGPRTYPGIRIWGRYTPDPRGGGDALEKLTYPTSIGGGRTGTAVLEARYRCPNDPWRNQVLCEVVSWERIPAKAPEPMTPHFMLGGTNPNVLGHADPGLKRKPLSTNAALVQKIYVEIAKINGEAKPPYIGAPTDDQVIPHTRTDFPVKVYWPRREGWNVDLDRPAGIKGIHLRWYRESGGEWVERRTQLRSIMPPREESSRAEYRVDVARLEDGHWRLEAGWSGGAAPSNWLAGRSTVEFWVGEKTDFSKPAARILEPADRSLHGSDPVKALVVHVAAVNPNKPKAPATSAPGTGSGGPTMEVEWVQWNLNKEDWDWEFLQTREHPSNLRFNLLNGGEGMFKIRTRARTSARLKNPWSSWVTYYVGQAGAELEKRKGLRPEAVDRILQGDPHEEVEPAQVTSEAMKSFRPAPPMASAVVALGNVKIRFHGSPAAAEYGVEYQRWRNGQWRSISAAAYDTLRPPAREIVLPLGTFGNSNRARFRARSQQPIGTWSPWQEFALTGTSPLIQQRPPVSPPQPTPPPAPSVKGVSKPPTDEPEPTLKTIPRP